MREWLATRAARKERCSELKDLIQGGFRDRPAPRKFDNQLLGPVAGKRDLDVILRAGQRVRNEHLLHRTVKIRHLGA
ncbi:hypothetical protein [Nonomuraea jabiensis]|uniref:hypothetical protein n=1 Tax=Nonomuraea jabiensis TaxID=882448 RepID=UPI003D765BE4